MVRNNFDSLPHMPEFTDEHAPHHVADDEREDPLDEGFELDWREAALRVAVLLVGLVGIALIWLCAATVYGWITR